MQPTELKKIFAHHAFNKRLLTSQPETNSCSVFKMKKKVSNRHFQMKTYDG